MGRVHCPRVADGRLKPPAPGLFPLEAMTDRLDYKVELDTYSGPLDLLLYLIRQSEVDLWNIPIARITEQYLRYMELTVRAEHQRRRRIHRHGGAS